MAAPSPLLLHCPESLPATAYLDAGWHARERRGIWAREWVPAGRLNDLPLGTLRAVQVAGESVVLCRDAAGRVTAFHNTCRHRGAEICGTADRRIGRLITCPYHAWAYDTDGRLVATGHATPTADFRRADHGLFPVQVQIWNGFILLCLAPDPPGLAPDAGLAALDNWPMDSLLTGHRMETVLACNWKVFWENYNECLHCPGIHPELTAMVPVYAKGIMSVAEDPAGTDAPILRPGARSWTQTGAPCGPEFPGLTTAERNAGHTFVTLYPAMFVVAHVDHVRAVALTPLGPQETRLTAEWLFSAETLAAPGFDLAHVTDFAATVMRQDAAACEMNQRGLRSARFGRGRLMPQEFDIYNFHRWVLARIAPEETP